MTAPTVNTRPTSFAGRRHRPAQWLVMGRMLAASAIQSLLITTGVMLAIIAIGALFARWRGWQLVEITETNLARLEVSAGTDGVTIVASLFLLPVAVGIASLVMAIVLAARTRVYVASGATRGAVAVGHLLTILVMTACTLLVTVAVLLVVGGGFDGAGELLGADGAGDVVVLTVQALGAVLLALTAGSAITALFLRWPWWVGATALVLLFVVLPSLTAFLLPSVAGVVDGAAAWWGWDLSVAVLATIVYWWVIRRVPVR